MTDEKQGGAGSGGRGGDRGDRRNDEGLSVAGVGGLGLQFAISIVLFLYIGRWADGKTGTAPLFQIIGAFVGAAASFYSIYRRLTAAERAEELAKKAKDARKATDE
jgi:ATP synthase protein I